MSDDFEVETMARNIALWHGQRMCYRDHQGEMQTTASAAGYGHFGDAPARYSDTRWQQYTAAAEAILDKHRGDLKRLQDEISELKGELESALYASVYSRDGLTDV